MMTACLLYANYTQEAMKLDIEGMKTEGEEEDRKKVSRAACENVAQHPNNHKMALCCNDQIFEHYI